MCFFNLQSSTSTTKAGLWFIQRTRIAIQPQMKNNNTCNKHHQYEHIGSWIGKKVWSRNQRYDQADQFRAERHKVLATCSKLERGTWPEKAHTARVQYRNTNMTSNTTHQHHHRHHQHHQHHNINTQQKQMQHVIIIRGHYR